MINNYGPSDSARAAIAAMRAENLDRADPAPETARMGDDRTAADNAEISRISEQVGLAKTDAPQTSERAEIDRLAKLAAGLTAEYERRAIPLD